MKNELIDRYLYAVTKRMDPKIREDVKHELETLIEDMLTERCGDGEPGEKDVRVVLTELGTPQELYAKYDESSKQCLIGQPHYSTYRLVLKIVLACVVFGITVASVILQMMEPREWYAAVGNCLANILAAVVGMFAFTTLIFAFLYHKGIMIDESFELNDLPPVPRKKQEVSVWEAVAGIAFILVFLAVFLVVPQIFSAVVNETGELIPIFDTVQIRSRWYLIVLFALAGILRESVKLLERRYNKTVMITSVAVDILSAVLSIWWLGGSDVINPVFRDNVIDLFAGSGEFLTNVFANFDLIFLAVILFALALDAVNAIVRSIDR